MLSAMRHFAEALRARGIVVDYGLLPDPDNSGSFRGELLRAVQRRRPRRVVVTEPGEWRVLEDIRGWERAIGVPVEIRVDDRFLTPTTEFARWAAGRKSLRMEYFYREMRRKTRLLLDDAGEPLGGNWNLDADNRRPLPGGVCPPSPKRFAPDTITREVIELTCRRFASHFGDLEPFWFAVTAAGAQRAFDHFVATALPFFGNYQDAMQQGEKTLFHAISVYT